MKKKKPYIPKTKFNPVIQAKKIEKIDENIEKFRHTIDAITKSHDNHISHLGNFARHDIKNAIHSMDTILSTKKPEDFTHELLSTLASHVKTIRETLDNFAKLVPYSSSGSFKLNSLMLALELLARTEFQNNDIDVEFVYDRETDLIIELPFQAILQMLNNLIINSIKALEGVEQRKLLLSAGKSSDFQFYIQIDDNGSAITPENKDKIFEFGFSTTGGSGIGLFHAKYICDSFNGSIKVLLDQTNQYNKSFIITLPLQQKNEKDCINN